MYITNVSIYVQLNFVYTPGKQTKMNSSSPTETKRAAIILVSNMASSDISTEVKILIP
jgi:hypothetical protein